MNARQSKVVGLLAALTMCAACGTASPVATDPELMQICASTTDLYGRPLDVHEVADARVQSRFGSVCHSLERLDGIDFGNQRIVYACTLAMLRRAIPGHGPSPAQLLEAFGRPIDLKMFDHSLGEADDVRARIYDGANNKEEIDNATPNAVMSLGGGVIGTFIVLTDDAGQVDAILFTRGETKKALRAVTSLAGALDLVELENYSGFVNAVGARRPLCTAGTIERNSSGWTIGNVHVHENCSPAKAIDIRVEKTGSIAIVKSRPASDGVSCAD